MEDIEDEIAQTIRHINIGSNFCIIMLVLYSAFLVLGFLMGHRIGPDETLSVIFKMTVLIGLIFAMRHRSAVEACLLFFLVSIPMFGSLLLGNYNGLLVWPLFFVFCGRGVIECFKYHRLNEQVRLQGDGIE